MFKNIILAIIAILPISIILKVTFEKDKIEKEPLTLLLKLFISGVLSAIVALFLTKGISSLININNQFYKSFIKVSFIEEICKWIFIYLITWKNKEFNYKFDAIVYCIFVSLGFAFIENIGYSFSYGLTTSLLRAIISVPGHAFFAIYMGYYLGMAKMNYSKHNNKDGFKYTLYSLLIPTALHGIYDYCLGGQNSGLYILFIIFIIALYILSFKTINTSSNMDIKLENKNHLTNSVNGN